MNIYDLQRTIGQRLHARQLQAARYGISADPSITNEARDLAELKQFITQTITTHECNGFTRQLEQTTIKKARDLGIFIDALEYD